MVFDKRVTKCPQLLERVKIFLKIPELSLIIVSENAIEKKFSPARWFLHKCHVWSDFSGDAWLAMKDNFSLMVVQIPQNVEPVIPNGPMW